MILEAAQLLSQAAQRGLALYRHSRQLFADSDALLRTTTLELIAYNRGKPRIKRLMKKLGSDARPKRPNMTDAADDDDEVSAVEKKTLTELIEFVVVKSDTLRALALAVESDSSLMKNTRTAIRVQNIRTHLRQISVVLDSAV